METKRIGELAVSAVGLGCNNFGMMIDQDGTRAVVDAAGVLPWASVQNHYSLLTRDPETDGVFDACARLGTAFVPFFPLESGLLTGKYRAGEERPDDARLARWGDRSADFIDDDRLTAGPRRLRPSVAPGASQVRSFGGWGSVV